MTTQSTRKMWLARRGIRWTAPVKGWERDGWGGALVVRKSTSSGVEHKLRVWRYARWDFALVLWRGR